MEYSHSPLQTVELIEPSFENSSGGGKTIVPPAGVKGWSWGAFLLNWIWAAKHNESWLGLFCFMPIVGIFPSFYLGIKGRELAWRNKRWDSLDHFNQVQKKWSIWALVLNAMILVGIGILFLHR